MNSLLECQDIAEIFELAAKRKSGRKLSQAQLAKLLGYSSPRAVGMVQSGKRPASSDMLLRLSRMMKLTDREHRFVSLLNQKKRRASPQLDQQLQSLRTNLEPHRKISDSEMRVLTSWYFLAIKQCLQARAVWTIKQLCQALEEKVSKAQIQGATRLLEDLGLCQTEGSKILSTPATAENLRSTFDIPSESIRKFHRNVLEKAAASLDEQGVLDREYLTATVRIRRDQVPEFKSRLREFLDEFLADCGTEGSDEIYQLGLYLFRVGKL